MSDCLRTSASERRRTEREHPLEIKNMGEDQDAAMASSSSASPIICISAGASHTVCLSSNALSGSGSGSGSTTTLYTWGSNEDGQLGHEDSENTHYPKEVETIASTAVVSTVVCGANHTVAVVEASKELYAWGWGDFGRLGHGDPGDRLIPAPVAALTGVQVQNVACGDSHCLVVAREGKLFTFGRNQNGQLGLGDTEDRLTPMLVSSLWDQGVRVKRAAGKDKVTCIYSQTSGPALLPVFT